MIHCKTQSFAEQANDYIYKYILYRSVIIPWGHIEIAAKQLNVSIGFSYFA